MPYKDSEMQRLKSRQYYQKHKEKCLASSKAWRDKHPDKIKEYVKRAMQKRKERYKNDPEYRKRIREQEKRKMRKRLVQIYALRDQIFVEHGNKCDKCGFNDSRALEIHHVFGDNSKNNYQRLKQLIERKVPLMVLCANCHTILHNTRKVP